MPPMHGSQTIYCWRDQISVDWTACFDCEFYGEWDSNPNAMPECWYRWELTKSSRENPITENPYFED